MRSKKMTAGLEKAPHRALLYSLGLTREEMSRPLVGVGQLRQRGGARPPAPGHHRPGRQGRRAAGRRRAPGVPGHRRVRRTGHEPRGHALQPAQPGDHRRFHRNHGHGPPLRRPGAHTQLRQGCSGHAHGHAPPQRSGRVGERRPHARRNHPGRPHGPYFRVRGGGPRPERGDERGGAGGDGRVGLPRLRLLLRQCSRPIP